MDPTSPRRPIVALAGFLVLVIGLAVLGTTALTVVRNDYIGLGYTRTALIVAGESARALAFPLAGLALFGALAAGGVAGRRGGGAPRGTALGIASAAALGACLVAGYTYNRYHADVTWSWMREWNGLRLPSVLWEPSVLATNAGLVIAPIVFGWLLYRALWLVFRRAPRAFERLYALAAHPVTPVAGAVALGAVAVAADRSRAQDPSAPNVLVVCIDTLRADHLGCYGYDRPTSPILDRLAEESVVFEWAISQAEATLPSHVSLFTSQLPTTHGVWNYRYELSDRAVTLPEILREAGYRTAAFVDAGHLLGLFGFAQGFDVYHDRYKRLEGSVTRALGWLDRIPDGDRYFLFVHGYDVHTPYAPWSPHRPLFVDPNHTAGFEPTVRAMGEIGWDLRHEPAYQHPLSEADVRYVVDCYDAAIRWADDQVGRLLDGLDARGLLVTTWVIVLSDHGEEFLEHGALEHDTLYHTVTHVPLLIRPPGPRGRWEGHRVPDVVGLVDVAPTVLDVAGLVSPGIVEGRSLAGHLGTAPDPTTPAGGIAYAQNWRRGHQRAVTTPDLHIVSFVERPDSLEVYAYREDPLERSPVLLAGRTNGSGADSTRATALGADDRAAIAAFFRWVSESAKGAGGTEVKRLFGNELETLKNLGYIR